MEEFSSRRTPVSACSLANTSSLLLFSSSLSDLGGESSAAERALSNF